MPASQTGEYKGFRIGVRPAFWLRRWTHFPLYFQATQPSFEFEIQKVADAESQPKTLAFRISFANNAFNEYQVDLPSDIGDRVKLKTNDILLICTGDTQIRRQPTYGQEFHTLYAFYVSPEATLVFLILNAILGVLFTTVAALLLR